MAPHWPLQSILMVTWPRGQEWVGGVPPGLRVLQGCAPHSTWGWVSPGQGLVRSELVSLRARPSWKHAPSFQGSFTPPSAALPMQSSLP